MGHKTTFVILSTFGSVAIVGADHGAELTFLGDAGITQRAFGRIWGFTY